jgi:sulfatase maturation enzyme AslB (radical SAM superfamily)
LVIDHQKVHEKSKDITMDNGFQYPGKTKDDAFEQIKPHIADVYEIYFAGGEPLMQDDHYKVLDQLFAQNKQNVKIYYNTNFSSLKLGKWNVLEYWKNMKNVVVSASIDGMGHKAEYWRKNTVWSDIESNIQQLKQECPNVKFMINPTVGWPNVKSVLEMHKSLVERGLLNVNHINVNLLDGPPHYSLKVVPLWKKESIILLINEHVEWLKTLRTSTNTIASFQNIIDFMMSSHEDMDIKTFHRVTNRLDAIRDEQFFEVFPEHDDMLKYMTDQGYIFERGLFPSYDWGNK